jgi:hypothetical protein
MTDTESLHFDDHWSRGTVAPVPGPGGMTWNKIGRWIARAAVALLAVIGVVYLLQLPAYLDEAAASREVQRAMDYVAGSGGVSEADLVIPPPFDPSRMDYYRRLLGSGERSTIGALRVGLNRCVVVVRLESGDDSPVSTLDTVQAERTSDGWAVDYRAPGTLFDGP